MTGSNLSRKDTNHAFQAEEREPLDVLDLPQIYQRPSARDLLATLEDLKLTPPSWDMSPRSAATGSSITQRQRKIKSEGVPMYLTRIISSPLAWIEDDEEKESIWEAASQRLGERSGRTAVGAITRTFSIALNPDTESASRLDGKSAESSLATSSDDMLDIILHEPALTADNLGLKTWASSYLLAKRMTTLRPHLPDLPKDEPALELGAGTGLVGMASSALLKRAVILTDLPDIVPNLQRNVQANTDALKGGSAECAVLDWSDPADFTLSSGVHPAANSFSLVLSADPIYSDEHPRLLVQTIDHHMSRSSKARLVLELPLRDAYAAERHDLRTRLIALGLEVLQEGEETGYDDWSNGEDEEELAEVTCWWSVWSWAEKSVDEPQEDRSPPACH